MSSVGTSRRHARGDLTIRESTHVKQLVRPADFHHTNRCPNTLSSCAAGLLQAGRVCRTADSADLPFRPKVWQLAQPLIATAARHAKLLAPNVASFAGCWGAAGLLLTCPAPHIGPQLRRTFVSHASGAGKAQSCLLESSRTCVLVADGALRGRGIVSRDIVRAPNPEPYYAPPAAVSARLPPHPWD